MRTSIKRLSLRHSVVLAWTCLAALVLGACSAPQVVYNNADTLLRYRLYDYFDPTQEQDIMMSAALERLHAWHRRHELPAYAATFARLAQRVETGLRPADIDEARELAAARYERLAAQALDEALPILRTFNASNFEALRDKFEELNADYADDFLDSDAAARHEAMVEKLTEHVERWVDDLNDTQIKLLEAVAARHPRFAELRLENRRHLQDRFIAVLRRVASNDAAAEAELRDVVVNWESNSLPQYRAALRAWEDDFRATLHAIERSLTPEQRREAVARLREYSEELYALTEGGAPSAKAPTRTGLAGLPGR